ncbi:MAG: hypothetical protein FWH55_00425 [Oscillospiraceae bacterium]|nr:hypothetical protein [Oscillospiraceae bacterium]
MGKKLIAALIFSFLLMPTLVAYADVIVEPENDFFNRYRNECVFLGRSFCAVDEDGTTPVKKAPNSAENVAYVASAEIIYVEYSCLYKGEFWGLTSRYPDNGWQELYGWVKLNEFYVLYDYVAFEEDYSKDFYAYNGDFDTIKETRAAIAWPWPGADSPLWTIEDIDITNFRVLHAYKDRQDREWGFVTYLYGSPNIWFCLSDPLNRDIPVFNPAPKAMKWEPETVHNDIGKSGNTVLVIIIILVVLLVVSTVILIKVFWKPNEQKLGGYGDD